MERLNYGNGRIYDKGEEMEKVSPFTCYPGMTYRRVRNRDCSIGEIGRMIANGILDERHDLVIKMLGKYGYLNSYLIRTCLENISGGRYAYDVSEMRRILRMLVNRGFLVQYEFRHECEGVVHGSPFIYSISGGGLAFLKKQGIKGVHPLAGRPFNMTDALGIISTNQFHIRFMIQFGKSEAFRMDDYYGECYRKTGAGNLYCINLSDGSAFHIFLLSARKGDGWQKNYLMILRKIRAYACRSGIEAYAVLVVCETECMAMECARYKDCDACVRNMTAYYLTDTSLLGEGGMFDRVIDVSPQKDYTTRRTFALELGGGGKKRRNSAVSGLDAY